MKKELTELKKWIEEQKEVSLKGYVDSKDEMSGTMYASENTAYGLVIMKIDKLLSESLPSSSVTGEEEEQEESEAIGERKFTLKEALDIWESASKSAYNCVYPEAPCSFNSEQHTQDKQAYFISIGIDKI